MIELTEWESFYLITGGAAGALIGLQFVVLTLLADKPLHKGAAETGAAFLTPTIFHFGTTLFLSALLCIPWQTFGIPSVMISVTGLAGIAYTGVVARRMRTQEGYSPTCEDWFFHIGLPLIAFGILAVSLFVAPLYLNTVLFGTGAAVLLLLFIGIHNAWDNISYTVFFYRAEQE